MSLFQLGDFDLHSGGKSKWKIECDELTEEDWRTLAAIAMERFNLRFSEVYGVPYGGLAFANALHEYRVKNKDAALLLVDDVLTTGNSLYIDIGSYNGQRLLSAMDEGRVILKMVAFARGKVPDGVYAVWRLG